ncbi:unnamed protein product, partial [Musa hybrid cultivar]
MIAVVATPTQPTNKHTRTHKILGTPNRHREVPVAAIGKNIHGWFIFVFVH